MKHIIGGIGTQRPAQVKNVVVDEDSSGQRLDNFLLRELKGVPKTHVYRIIRSGEVRLNQHRTTADARVTAGDVVRLPPLRVAQPADVSVAPLAPAREFPILFEDDHLLAIDKPSGIAVHGGSGVSFGVIESVRRARPQARFLELVHRLDRDTSGVLLLAKKRSALTQLQQQFRQRQTGKTYLALVAGCWPANKKVLDKPLFKYLLGEGANGAHGGEKRVKVVARDDPSGRPALTLVKVVRQLAAGADVAALAGDGFTLLAVTLKTGRTHQIRVHLASEGYPIVGDDKYGNFNLNKALLRSGQSTPLKRMFLHAWHLEFNHPVNGERLTLIAPLPTELEAFLSHDANFES